jgi:transposase
MKKGDKVYLCEYKSVREGSKVKSVFVRYLGVEGQQEKVPLPKKQIINWKPPERSTRTGDVSVLWTIAQDLRIAETIDRIVLGQGRRPSASPGKLLTLWAINRALEPESATQLGPWIQSTDLCRLAGIKRAMLGKDTFLDALDSVCSINPESGSLVNHIPRIDEMLYHGWRQKHPLPSGESEILAYDLTSVMVFGETCPLAEKGYNAEDNRHRQIKLAVLVSKFDRQPLGHVIYQGATNSVSTVEELIPRLADFAIQDGTVIWDRGNTSRRTITTIERHGWRVLCGVPKSSKDARALVAGTEVHLEPGCLVPCKRSGELYATKVTGELFGKTRDVVVYLNVNTATKCLVERNRAIHDATRELERLEQAGRSMKMTELEPKIRAAIDEISSFFTITYGGGDDACGFTWEIDQDRLNLARQMDGKYLLYASDPSIGEKEVVQLYMQKDNVEKVFRILKTDEEVRPIRHRLECRVRAYMLVCMLAYRLLAALRHATDSSSSSKVTMSPSVFMKKCARIHRMEVVLGKEIEIFYVNVSGALKDQAEAIGMKGLFNPERRPIE